MTINFLPLYIAFPAKSPGFVGESKKVFLTLPIAGMLYALTILTSIMPATSAAIDNKTEAAT